MTTTVDIAWIGVLLAALAGFAMNMLWFSERGFYTTWQQALGSKPQSDESSGEQSGMGLAFGSVTLALFLQAFAVDWLLQASAALYGHSIGAVAGLLIGAGAGVAFAAATSLGHRIFAGQGFKVWFIEIGADVIGLALMGLILSFWR